ncbi:DUF1648 domain-containing protein [Corynebacterium lizhenjunii]|uniref:DUF1648 domain-containing protein n=1 Tax=Corynebacterium lizhenjunii TaxID=2709394 RepID=A0A7T0KG01_9CORY|nr:DUF1648 domain-containing protein [Corynebacterium lizhenjunii]QPK79419.1 DUF1648 domain-containing protein [Corynebacterium lizhenjunii]
MLAVIMVAAVLLAAGVLAALPAFQPASPLGVRVPRAHLADASAPIRTYRLTVTGCGMVAALLAAVFREHPAAFPLSIALPLVGAAVAWQWQRAHLARLKETGRWFEGKATAIAGRITPEDLPRASFPWGWMACSVLVTLVAVYVVAAQWEQIPGIIPTHWGPGMQPDAWSEKSVGSVFIPAFVNLGLIVVMAATIALMRAVRVHPRTDRTTRGQLRSAAQIVACIRGLGVLVFLMSTGIAVLQVASPLPRYAEQMGYALAFMLTLTFIGVIIALVASLRAPARLEQDLAHQNFPDSTAESPNNDHHYRLGLFYYNPADPAIVVDRRAGVGMDFNYAHWQGKAFAAVVLAIVVGSLLAAFIV